MRNLGYWKITLLAATLAAPLVAGCGKTVGETIDDTTITTRVKTAMLNDPAVGGLRIDVDTYKGVVTLSGRVKSQTEHDQWPVRLSRDSESGIAGKPAFYQDRAGAEHQREAGDHPQGDEQFPHRLGVGRPQHASVSHRRFERSVGGP